MQNKKIIVGLLAMSLAVTALAGSVSAAPKDSKSTIPLVTSNVVSATSISNGYSGWAKINLCYKAR